MKNKYNYILDRTLAKDRQNPGRYDGTLTDFAYTNGPIFEQMDFVSPPLLKSIPPVRFYKVADFTDQQATVLASQEYYRGNSPLTALAILKKGSEARLGNDAVLFPDVPKEDVEVGITISDIARSQLNVPAWNDAYLLKKWPRFSTLLANYSPNEPSAFVPSITSGAGVTISPFQHRRTSVLYFIYDQYISIHNVKQLSKSSRDSNIVLVQRLVANKLEDACYLVLAPSKVATTLE